MFYQHLDRISSLEEMDVLDVKGAKLEMPNVEDNLPGDLCR